jgi:hypothetical protein
MLDMPDFLKGHLNEIAYGGALVLAALGILKEKISSFFARISAKHQRRISEEKLATIPPEASPADQMQEQERLARLKIVSGENIGVAELAELAQRTSLTDATRQQLAKLLVRNHPSQPSFDEILNLLCRSRVARR